MGSQTVLFNLCTRVSLDGHSFESEKMKNKKETGIRIGDISRRFFSVVISDLLIIIAFT